MGFKASGRLDSWKEIASYLDRDVRTVIRWEKERGLPVHRVPGQKGHGVFALASEVDAWLHTGPSSARMPTVAVLPLLHSESPEHQYICDGLSQSIISTMSRISHLRVMAWTTVCGLRATPVDARQLGHELRVDTVMTGQVSRRNSFWLASVELVNTSDGTQRWSKQFTLPMLDLQLLPTQIATEVLKAMGIHVGPEEERRLAPHLVRNTEAYDSYLRGRYHSTRFSYEDFLRAIECFERAVVIEPTFAQAHAELAWCYTMLGVGYGDRPPREVLAKADAAACKAIELDEMVGEAHAALAFASTYRGWDWQFVEKELRRAIELSPSYSLAHMGYGVLLNCIGRYEEGIEELEWAAELDHATLTSSGDFPFYLALLGRTEEALQIVKKNMTGPGLTPEAGTLHYVLGVIFERQGKYAEAMAELEKAVKLNLLHTIPLGVLGYIYAVCGEEKKALAVIAQLDELARQRPVSHFTKAIVLAGLGHVSLALECLEKAHDERSPFLYMLNVFPWLDSLRSESRFADLVHHVGLPESPNRNLQEKEVFN